jgi:putative tricarboxylic transport membrane protein
MTDNSSGADKAETVDQQSEIGLIHRTDLIVALIVLVGTLTLYYFTTQFEEVSPMLSQNIGPELFPQILLIVIFALTLVLPLEHLFLEGGAPRLDKERKTPVNKISWLTIGLMVLIVVLMPILGTLLTIVAICVFLPLLWGERRIRIIAPFAIIFPTIVTLVFSTLLKVHFLPGLLEYIL